MSIKTVVCVGCLLAGVASVAGAQTSIDRSFKAVSKTCDGIQWSEQALKTYPSIASACQGVEERDGITYVKFQATVKRNVDKGKQLVADFKGGGEVTLTPPAETQLYVDGRRTSVKDLRPGTDLNFYIAENRLAAQFPETESLTTRVVVVPIYLRDEAVEDSEQLASLPATASLLPLAALCGFLLLTFGAAFTLYRWRGTGNR